MAPAPVGAATIQQCNPQLRSHPSGRRANLKQRQGDRNRRCRCMQRQRHKPPVSALHDSTTHRHTELDKNNPWTISVAKVFLFWRLSPHPVWISEKIQATLATDQVERSFMPASLLVIRRSWGAA